MEMLNRISNYSLIIQIDDDLKASSSSDGKMNKNKSKFKKVHEWYFVR